MKINIKDFILPLISFIGILLSLMVVVFLVNAAVDLDAPSAPSLETGTMKTLENIYQRIVAGTSAGLHNIYPSASPAGTMHTLDDIYNAIPNNNKVCSGTNSGTAICDPIEWSPLIGEYQLSDAKAYCENPDNNYTRLPTFDELTKALVQQYFENGTGPAGFLPDIYYWSNTESNASGNLTATIAIPDNTYLVTSVDYDQPESLNYFRCVC